MAAGAGLATSGNCYRTWLERTGPHVKLVTYDDGNVGYVDGQEIVRFDVPTMREWFERGGADESGERTPLAEAKLRAPIVPKKFFHTAGNFREHEARYLHPDEVVSGAVVFRDGEIRRQRVHVMHRGAPPQAG